VHAANATGAQIAAAERTNAEAQRVFRLYHAVDAALKAQLLQAVADLYIQALANPHLQYANVTCLDILTHLWESYGIIAQQELDANIERMNAAWHPPSPIESLWSQLDLARAFATAAGEMIPVSNVIRMGYNILFRTGQFSEACRKWRQRLTPAGDAPTIAQFKEHFHLANEDRRLLATTSSAGYNSANSATTPTSIPSLLCMTTQTAITAAVAAAIANHLQATPTARNTPAAKVYCWTYGVSLNPSHTSATCRKQLPGHQPTATLDNKMGGSTFVQYRRTPRVESSE